MQKKFGLGAPGRGLVWSWNSSPVDPGRYCPSHHSKIKDKIKHSKHGKISQQNQTNSTICLRHPYGVILTDFVRKFDKWYMSIQIKEDMAAVPCGSKSSGIALYPLVQGHMTNLRVTTIKHQVLFPNWCPIID